MHHHISAPHLPYLYETPPTLRADRNRGTVYPMETPYQSGTNSTGQTHKRSVDERSPVKESKAIGYIEVIASGGSPKKSKVMERSKCNGVEGLKSGESMFTDRSTTEITPSISSPRFPVISVRPANGCCVNDAAAVTVRGPQSTEQALPGHAKKAGKSQGKDPGLKRRLFAGNKHSQQCQVVSDLEQCPLSPLAEFKAMPTDQPSLAKGVSSDNASKNSGGKSSVSQSPKQTSLISNPASKRSPHDKASNNSACSNDAKAKKKMSRNRSITDTWIDKKTQRQASVSINDKRKKWQAKNREVSVSVGWSSTSSVTTTISGSLECLLDAVDTEMPSVRRERVKSLPRSPSMTALYSFDMSGTTEESDVPHSSDHINTPLCDPCLQREKSTESVDGLLTQSPNAAFLRRSYNDLTGRGPSGGSGGAGNAKRGSLTVEWRSKLGGKNGNDSEMSGEEGEENFESCESVSSVESTGEL